MRYKYMHAFHRNFVVVFVLYCTIYTSCQSLVHLVIFAHASHEVFFGAMAGALLGCGYFLLLRRRPSKEDKFQYYETITVYELSLSTFVVNANHTNVIFVSELV